MLKKRIIDTISFFDLQDYPLTAYEVQRYLVSEKESLRKDLDEHHELSSNSQSEFKTVPVQFDTVILQLDELVATGAISGKLGFYCLPGKERLIRERLLNYRFGIKRERLIRRYLFLTRHIPFVRGIALAGSQALGLQRSTSDIDLLIITDSRFMWLARTMLTFYFQVLGVRRHGQKIANRFCLNHYLANPREVDAERNLYKAMEYVKLRPVVYPEVIEQFQKANQNWIRRFFPNVLFNLPTPKQQSAVQYWAEKIIHNRLGLWIEAQLGSMQLKRIRQDKFIFVKEDELSFHPESKHEVLLNGFFK